MPRTTETLVKGVLLDDYDDSSAPSLIPFIDTATIMVDRVESCAAKKGMTLTTAELEMIERWLSAHYYGQTDKPYASRSTAGASGSFHGRTDMGLDSTLYGQTAKRLDYSGCLEALDKRNRASFTWLGKPPSEQIPYSQRN